MLQVNLLSLKSQLKYLFAQLCHGADVTEGGRLWF